MNARVQSRMLNKGKKNLSVSTEDFQNSLSHIQHHVNLTVHNLSWTMNNEQESMSCEDTDLQATAVPKNIATGLTFKNEPLIVPQRHWLTIMWTDETKVHTFLTVKSGGEGFVGWDCFASSGSGRIAISGKIHSKVRQDILHWNLRWTEAVWYNRMTQMTEVN